jgi:hypothetical protein
MLPYKSDGGRGAGAGVGRLIMWSGLDPFMGEKTTPKFLAIEESDCNFFQNAEINIFYGT